MDLIACLEARVGQKPPRRISCRSSRATCPRTFADVDALAADVGFRPATPIDEGVRRFVDWYKDYYKVG